MFKISDEDICSEENRRRQISIEKFKLKKC